MFRSRPFWLFIALLIVPHLGACQATSDCDKLLDTNHVLRVDDAAKRLFVLSSERTLADNESAAKAVRELGSIIEKCGYRWNTNWSLSFFATAESAGYKDDSRVTERVASGAWARDYLAEFTNATRMLVQFPAIPEQRTELKIE